MDIPPPLTAAHSARCGGAVGSLLAFVLPGARKTRWRSVLGLLLALALGWASGPIIRSGGFGGWILWIFCIFACPAVVTIVTDRWYFVLAPMTAVLMAFSVEYQNYLFYQKHSDDAWYYLKMNFDIAIEMAVFSLIISLFVAYAAYKLRKA